ncbi:uncharacterized protein KIAA0408 homolog isoform X2 [Protopterus annectens]|uniref:uncharacterized protein KIAA0408 homolog isoform X2 n=1 Tax=Protopterus annectens TaxID=7888 RepID=UPI001CFB6002|nr:uncharacterized protein KIAA0408 homolog isoform X2 [Protopterus annectens]
MFAFQNLGCDTAGENRRLLLELKSTLEAVQTELRKEERRRTDLQQQYSNDRFGWELERAELKCRITQLESKATKHYTDRNPQDLKEAFRKEREEQKRLLTDTHTAAMDLRKQLEINENIWKREKLELLERFDSERNEWERQLKDMQKKIEELYQEVKSKRENDSNDQELMTGTEWLHLSIHSSNSESSDPADCGEAVHHHNRESMEVEQILLNASDCELKNASKQKNSPLFIDELAFENSIEPDDCQVVKLPGNDKMSYTSALNAALREIAKVSEELCSYQDEIRKKSSHQRLNSFQCSKECEPNKNGVKKTDGKTALNDSQASGTFFKSLWDTEEMNRKNWMSCSPPSLGDKLNATKNEAPPVPPRSTSWHLTPTLSLSSQITDLGRNDGKSCMAQNIVSGRKSSSPLLVKKSEAVLFDNRLIGDPVCVRALATNLINDTNSVCNDISGSSRWPCYVTKLGTNTDNRSSCNVPIQKCLSEANTLSSEKTESHLCKSPTGLECFDNLFPTPVTDNKSLRAVVATEDAGDTLCSLQAETDKRQTNEMLATKIAEFNRVVFHTDKRRIVGHGNVLTQSSVGDGKQAFVKTGCMTRCTEKELSGQCVPHSKTSAFSEYIATSHNTSRSKTGKCSPHMNDDQDWSPSRLLGRPRSSDSRSNFGVVEKLLKNYEKSVATSVQVSPQCSKNQQIKSSSGYSRDSSDSIFQYLEMIQTEQEKTHKQSPLAVGRQLLEPTEKSKLPEKSQLTVLPTVKKFSRSARPANRRLPSRWAAKASSVQPSQTFSFSFHSETTIV